MIDIFVSSPYTDDDPSIIARRVEQAEQYIAHLTTQGAIAYSTIAAMAHIVEKYELKNDYPFWQSHCEQMISSSDEVHVLMLDGWQDSPGVMDEIRIADELDKPIRFIPQHAGMIRVPNIDFIIGDIK